MPTNKFVTDQILLSGHKLEASGGNLYIDGSLVSGSGNSSSQKLEGYYLKQKKVYYYTGVYSHTDIIGNYQTGQITGKLDNVIQDDSFVKIKISAVFGAATADWVGVTFFKDGDNLGSGISEADFSPLISSRLNGDTDFQSVSFEFNDHSADGKSLYTLGYTNTVDDNDTIYLNRRGSTANGGDNPKAVTIFTLEEWASGVPIQDVNVNFPTGILIVADYKAISVDGGTFTAGAWEDRDLNTIEYDTIGITGINTNQIPLDKGVYDIHAVAPANRVERHQIRLIDDNGVGLLSGSSAQSEADNFGGITTSTLDGIIQLDSATEVKIQHIGEVTKTSDGFGLASTWGSGKFTAIKIKKLD